MIWVLIYLYVSGAVLTKIFASALSSLDEVANFEDAEFSEFIKDIAEWKSPRLLWISMIIWPIATLPVLAAEVKGWFK